MSSSKFVKKEAARTHEEARTSVCCACWKKTGDRKEIVKVVGERWASLVRQNIFSEFSVINTAHPTALCVTCRLALSAIEKNPENPKRNLPPIPD